MLHAAQSISDLQGPFLAGKGLVVHCVESGPDALMPRFSERETQGGVLHACAEYRHLYNVLLPCFTVQKVRIENCQKGAV